MAAFHVFVEGAIDSSTAGVDRLAAAIASHYGLGVDELRMRLAKGRFRVKSNCDRATADSYVRDLTQLGARCVVEDAAAQSRPSTPAIATPPRGTPTPRTTTPPASSLKSGLAAAFGSEPSAASSLGALEDGGMLKLSSVDGADDAPAPPPRAAFAPPPPQVAPAKPAVAAVAPDAPVDMFAPPDAAEEAAFKVELADDEVERAAKKRASIPPANEPPPEAATQPAPPPPSRSSRPSLQHVPISSSPTGLADPKNRFALGVLVAIVVGFIPATLLASAREKSAYAEIDHAVDQTQREADTQDAYDALDAFRARQLSRKYDARQSAALLAMLVWGAAGAGIAYVWFRRIRWPETT
ncbi:MAG TPA: hypothetical protein VGG74_30555 [Kofleriaceae bacterium]|jgi:hypothetical protein